MTEHASPGDAGATGSEGAGGRIRRFAEPHAAKWAAVSRWLPPAMVVLIVGLVVLGASLLASRWADAPDHAGLLGVATARSALAVLAALLLSMLSVMPALIVVAVLEHRKARARELSGRGRELEVRADRVAVTTSRGREELLWKDVASIRRTALTEGREPLVRGGASRLPWIGWIALAALPLSSAMVLVGTMLRSDRLSSAALEAIGAQVLRCDHDPLHELLLTTRDLVERAPELGAVHATRARALAAAGDVTGALEVARTAVEVEPGSAEARGVHATLEHAAGDPVEAFRSEVAAALSSSWSLDHAGDLAGILLAHGDILAARRHASRALTLQSGMSALSTERLLVVADLASGRLDAAVTRFDRLAAQSDRESVHVGLRAAVLACRGERDEAQRLLRERAEGRANLIAHLRRAHADLIGGASVAELEAVGRLDGLSLWGCGPPAAGVRHELMRMELAATCGGA